TSARWARSPRATNAAKTSRRLSIAILLAAARAIAERQPSFLDAQHFAGRKNAVPQRLSFIGERGDLVEIDLDAQRAAVPPDRRQPMQQGARDAVRHRRDRLAPEGAIGLLIIGVGRVARQADQ